MEKKCIAVSPTTGLTCIGFVQGFSAAAMAESVTLPLDTLKVRRQLDPLQIRYKGSLHTIRTIFAEEGGFSFYNGLAAGVMRAGSIYAARLGTYEIALERVAAATSCDRSGIGVKLIAAIPVTVFSMLLGNPWDVLKVRAQRAPTAAVNEATKRGLFSISPHLIASIVRQEGLIGGLYAGFAPNLVRNMIIGSSELVAYYHTKQWLIWSMGCDDAIGTHVAASGVAGLTSAVLGSPFDTVASRVMQADAVKESIPWYRFAARMLHEEGAFAFYKGFGFNWMRLTGFNLALFVSFEQIRTLCATTNV